MPSICCPDSLQQKETSFVFSLNILMKIKDCVVEVNENFRLYII